MSHSTTVSLPIPKRSTGPAPFDLARRGYDRRQVDEHLISLGTQLAEARVAAQREQRRAERAERQLDRARTQPERQPPTPATPGIDVSEPGPSGFGYRVERLLRVAEQEAAEVRATATREAGALLERAREDAEAHRHEAEQDLISRTAALEEEAARQEVEIARREQEAIDRIASAREESGRMVAEARSECERTHRQAQDQLAGERAAAEEHLRERRLSAERELDRLRGLHDETRSQLARLLESLATEFGVTHRHPTAPGPRPRSRPDTARSEEPTLAVPVVTDALAG